ncbi:NADH-quinone oxidoreductase subunit NuoG [Acidocella aromatica]|uniref:NADH-quinone oxidoreductase n=1 Tax=Acidocella aromatica TaxID=1303579 RepID=A0A840VRH9_9PROT|nr:NADH-quinone oxidoreductase subunit NuoG [Acidocella aromatica]MBB5372882.1 NADH-quinone oxidoreductase subunit G [Acidocella aromatica]
MVKLTIDGIQVEVPAGSTVIQAADAAGIEIPRFCYHERLSIAGNCRMCLVEIEKMPPKPQASCGMPVSEGMVVHTDSEMVRKGRRGVMEFLLINHPLDCPICDQGGECDLQDEAVSYGRDYSRYDEQKRAVSKPDWGPLVRTTMTRCIHCTRCVRFTTEVAGTAELGGTFRGENTQIGTFVEKALTSELSGNIIDLCPVGALTSKPYAFTARPWELRKTDSVDVLDAQGAAIRVDARGAEVLRILPRLNDDVNEEWLGDKSRFAVDGLKRRRLDRPWLRENGKLRAASWEEAFATIANRIKGTAPETLGAIVGDLCDAESMLALKEFFTALRSPNLDCRQDGAAFDASRRAFYLFNTTIAGVEEADALLIIGSNPRHEAPVLNARIRKRWLAGGFTAGLVGEAGELTYPVERIGAGPEALKALADGTHPFAEVLKAAKKPMIILGAGVLARPDGAALQAAAWRLAAQYNALRADWHGFNVLHHAAARVGALDLGFLPGKDGKSTKAMLNGGVDVLWLLGADELDTKAIGKDTFVIYQGHHGDAGAARADVILPGAAYTEKHGTYVNTEGRVQQGFAAVLPPGDAREDWTIIRAISAYVGHALPYDTLEQLREHLKASYPVFGQAFTRLAGNDASAPTGNPSAVSAESFAPVFANYYQTDVISRASPTMAACVAAHYPAKAEAAE